MSLKLNNKNRFAFGYFGSKHKLALPIIGHLPPHNAWVDAFCGSAAVTLAKLPAPIEIINDINGDVINFFKQLRDHPQELQRLVTLTPYSRQELMCARQDLKSGNALEKARRFLVSAMMSMNGVFGSDRGGFSYSNSYARNGMEARVSRWCNVPKRLERIVERLRRLRIENQDARELLKQFLDRPGTLVYLDPPYLVERTKGYDCDQYDEKFHKELLTLACKAKCMIVISGYDSPLYNSMLKMKYGWKKIEIEAHTQGSNGKRFARTEVLWQNKHCLEAKRLKKTPIVLTKREKCLGKINPVR
jgi:DNA adenine methylase